MRSISILGAIALSGCAHTVNLSPNLAPTANIANPVPLKMGLFIPEAVKSYQTQDKSDWATQYTFEIGPALEGIISKSVERVFTSTESLAAYPTAQAFVDRGLDLVGVAKVTSAMTSLNTQEGFLQNTAKGTTNISVQVTFYNPQMIQVASIIGSGTGIGSQGVGLSTGKKEFSVSVEAAIRHLGDDLIQQIYGNYDIRKLAEAEGN